MTAFGVDMLNAGSMAGVSALLPYLGVLLAAIVEGEVAYIAAAALVAQGQLNAGGVLVSGAVGAAIGDQAYFYLLRGRLERWLTQHPSVQRRTVTLLGPVRRHSTLMVLLIRFAPGLRIALTLACASAGVPPLRFSVLNALSAFVWAAVLLAVVGWYGPTYLARFGLEGWQGALLCGAALLVLIQGLGWYERRRRDRATQA